MNLNPKLINQLREGKIVVKNVPHNKVLIASILRDAFPMDKSYKTVFGDSCFYRSIGNHFADGNPDNLPSVPIKDFLKPMSVTGLEEGESIKVSKEEYPRLAELLDKAKVKWITDQIFSSHNPWTDRSNGEDIPKDHIYLFKNEAGIFWRNKGDYAGMSIPETIYPAAAFSPEKPEPKYKANGLDWVASAFESTIADTPAYVIGKEYEFGDNENDWRKGTFLGVVNHELKHIASIPYGQGCDEGVFGFRNIRPIQPKEVTVPLYGIFRNGEMEAVSFEKDALERDIEDGEVIIPITGTYTI